MPVQSMLDPDEADSENGEDDEVDEDYEDAEPRPAPAQEDDEPPAQEGQKAPSNTNNAEEDGHINAVESTTANLACRSLVPRGKAPRTR